MALWRGAVALCIGAGALWRGGGGGPHHPSAIVHRAPTPAGVQSLSYTDQGGLETFEKVVEQMIMD